MTWLCSWPFATSSRRRRGVEGERRRLRRAPWSDRPAFRRGWTESIAVVETIRGSEASIEGRFGFQFGETTYSATLRNGELEVKRGSVGTRDVMFMTSPEGLAAVIYGGAPLETIAVQGDIELARRFVTLFPLPQKVGLNPAP